MRTTVTLDPDTESLLRREMERRGVSFKQALNDAIRAGMPGVGSPEPTRTPAVDLGTPMVSLDRALQLSGEIEDAELIQKIRTAR